MCLEEKCYLSFRSGCFVDELLAVPVLAGYLQLNKQGALIEVVIGLSRMFGANFARAKWYILLEFLGSWVIENKLD